MEFFEYFNHRYVIPPWPTATLPKTVIQVSFSDGSSIFTESGSFFLTKDGWVAIEDLVGEYVLVEPISTLTVNAEHYRDTAFKPTQYMRDHSKFIRVEETETTPYPIGVIGFVPNPGNGGPSPGGSGSPCSCVLSASPCGTPLMLPLVITP
jgi:hypothetical protein